MFKSFQENYFLQQESLVLFQYWFFGALCMIFGELFYIATEQNDKCALNKQAK